MQTLNAAGAPISQAFKDAVAADVNEPRVAVYVNWLGNAGWSPVPGGTSANLGPNDDISKYVEAVHIERSMSEDDVPVGARLLTGSIVSEAKVTVGGDEDNDIPGWQLWSPFATAEHSPFAETNSSGVRVGVRREGAQIRIFAGFDGVPDWVCVYTGYTRIIDMDYGDSSADITCYDPSERLRSAPRFDSFVADQSIAQPGDDMSWFRPAYWGADGHYLIDAALRQNGIYQSSPMNANAVLSVPGHGSLWPETTSNSPKLSQELQCAVVDARLSRITGQTPEVGMTAFGEYLYPAAGTVTNVQYAPAVQGQGTLENDPAPTWGPPSSPFNGMQFEYKFVVPTEPWPGAGNGPEAAQGFMHQAALYVHNGAIPEVYFLIGGDGIPQIQVFTSLDSPAVSTPGIALPTDGGVYYVAAHLKWTGTKALTVTWNVAGASHVDNLTLGTAPSETIWHNYGITSALGWFDHQLIRINAPDFSHATVRPTARLDQSLNSIAFIPYNPNPDDAFTTIGSVAAAEMGSIGFDELGVFQFYNRRHFLAAREPDIEVSDLLNLADLKTSEATDNVVNHAIIPITPYVLHEPAWVWATEHTRGLHSGETQTLIIKLQNPTVHTWNSIIELPYGGVLLDSSDNPSYPWNPNAVYLRACSDPKGNGDNLFASVAGDLSQPDPQTIALRLRNTGNRPLYFVSPRTAIGNDGAQHQVPTASVGKPMLQIGGFEVTQFASGNVVVANSSGDETGVSSVQVSSLTQAEQIDEDSAERYGEQVWKPEASVYRQDVGSMQAVADDVVAMLTDPIPQLGDVTIPYNPMAQLGDLMHSVMAIADLDVYGYLRGYTFDYNESQFDQTLSTQATIPTRGWVLGDAALSQLGQTTVLRGTL